MKTLAGWSRLAKTCLKRFHFFGHIYWVCRLLGGNLSWDGMSRRENWSACLLRGDASGFGELLAAGFDRMQELVC